jgi:hypothetical protein
LVFSVVSFLPSFPWISHMNSFSPICATFLTHLILLHFVILTILCKVCKLWSSPLYRFLQPTVTSCHQSKYSQYPLVKHHQSMSQ